MSIYDQQIRDLRAKCTAARNFPLARLCSDAVAGGSAEARIRVTAILAGEGDPGTGRAHVRALLAERQPAYAAALETAAAELTGVIS